MIYGSCYDENLSKEVIEIGYFVYFYPTSEDEVDNKIEFIEIKRQSKNFDRKILEAKSQTFLKAIGTFKDYEITYRELSIEDM